MTSVIKFVPAAVIITAAALMINAAKAAERTIIFDGRVIGQTCSIVVGGVASPYTTYIILPTVSEFQLSAAGKVAGRTNFEIELSNCSGGATTAAAFFEANDGIDPISGQLHNSGSAPNVRLQLLDNGANGTVIKPGDVSQLTTSSRVAIVDGSAILPYSVQYIATAPVTAGTVRGTVTYSINYQ